MLSWPYFDLKRMPIVPVYIKYRVADGHILLCLLLQGVDVNNMCDGRYPIHFAADYGQTEVVEYLISKGANVNVSEEFLQGILLGIFVRLCGVRHEKAVWDYMQCLSPIFLHV
mgnify:CR=1 FL=1